MFLSVCYSFSLGHVPEINGDDDDDDDDDDDNLDLAAF